MKLTTESLLKMYHKTSVWGKLIVFIFLFLIIITLFKFAKKSRTEGFEQSDSFLLKSDDQIYDGFYADIYDALVFNNIKDEYQVREIINKTNPTTESIILDIGSGTGHTTALFAEKGYPIIGMDNSNAMITKAKENYPQYNFVIGDIMRGNQFKPNSFTHLLCLYFTIYYFKDKMQFFNNCIDLLIPGGYLVVHIVNKHQFDPILPAANPLLLLTPQRYSKERIVSSKITFDNFKYEANFNLPNNSNEAVFIEKFKNPDTHKVFRKNEHHFYMEDEDYILSQAQQAGFLVQGKIDLIHSGYEYQYLYVLLKPE